MFRRDSVEDDGGERESSIHGARSIQPPNGSSNIPGYSFQTTCHGWRGQRCSISLFAEVHLSEASSVDETSAQSKTETLGLDYKNLWFPLSETCTVTPSAGLL